MKRPYGDLGEDAAPFVGADGDEIGAGAAVIVARQANGFPFWQFHDLNLRSHRRGGNLPPAGSRMDDGTIPS